MPLWMKRVIGSAFYLPWVMIELVKSPRERADSGYWIGLLCGIITAYLWSERPPKLWISALTALFLLTVRLILIFHYHFVLVHN